MIRKLFWAVVAPVLWEVAVRVAKLISPEKGKEKGNG